jgi:hypothetical protein
MDLKDFVSSASRSTGSPDAPVEPGKCNCVVKNSSVYWAVMSVQHGKYLWKYARSFEIKRFYEFFNLDLEWNQELELCNKKLVNCESSWAICLCNNEKLWFIDCHQCCIKCFDAEITGKINGMLKNDLINRQKRIGACSVRLRRLTFSVVTV